MNGIFRDTSAAYYDLGLPVIPLHIKEKRPIPLDWSRYHDHKVEEAQQVEWQDSCADGNIGIVLGQQSQMVMIDIDTTDQVLIDLLLSILPPSPWKRVGAKGMVLAYRWSGVRTFRIKDSKGDTVVEHLSDRTQVVLPPSIHPDTQMPYTANCDLVDVWAKLPVLPEGIESLLRESLKEAGVELSISGKSGSTDFVSKGARDVTLTEKAGLWAFAVLKGERALMEAIGMLRSFELDFVETVAGDDAGGEKHVDNLLRFLRRDVMEKGRVLPEGWDEGMTSEDKVALGVDFDKDHEEWTFEEIIQYLKDKFEQHPEESKGRAEAVDTMLVRVSRASNLTKIDEERLMQYVVDVGGLRLRLTALRSRLRELRSGDVMGQDHSEIAKAVLEDLEKIYTVRRHGTALWKYVGSHWEALGDNDIMARVAKDFGHLQAARRHSDHKGIYATMMNLAEEGIKRTDVSGVNFANGFLTEELELIEHHPDQGMVYTLPFRYLPELSGKSHQFFDFLESAWGLDADKGDKIAALQEALCVTLFGMGPRYQRAILCKGVAKGGKSQLLTIAQSLVPRGAQSFVPPHDWSDKFLPTMMHEKLINVCGELSEKKKIDGMKFKDIIDGAEMSGQHKGAQIFKFRPICTHWFASNHTPKTEDSSEGFNRRWLILEFNRPVSKERRKINLGETIVAEERESIVAWAVQAMARLKENREYTIPNSHTQLIGEIAQANNSVRFFIEVCPKIKLAEMKSNRISENKLYKEYWSFCLGPGGARPVGSRAFRGMMRELQFEKDFSLCLERTQAGAQEAFYEGITLAA